MPDFTELFADMDSSEIGHLLIRLRAFALRLLNQKYWQGRPGSVTGGAQESHDFVMRAIVDVLEGRRTTWNLSKNKGPNLERYLKGVIRSNMYRAAMKSENRREVRTATMEDGAGSTTPQFADARAASPLDNAVFNNLLSFLGSDPILVEMAKLIALGGTTAPRFIADDLGISMSAYNNKQRKLKRLLQRWNAEGRPSRNSQTSTIHRDAPELRPND